MTLVGELMEILDGDVVEVRDQGASRRRWVVRIEDEGVTSVQDTGVPVEHVVHLSSTTGVGLDTQGMNRRSSKPVVDGVVMDIHIVETGVRLRAGGDAMAAVTMVVGNLTLDTCPMPALGAIMSSPSEM